MRNEMSNKNKIVMKIRNLNEKIEINNEILEDPFDEEEIKELTEENENLKKEIERLTSEFYDGLEEVKEQAKKEIAEQTAYSGVAEQLFEYIEEIKDLETITEEDNLLKETITETVNNAKNGRYAILEECLPKENYIYIPQIIERVKEELDEKTFKRFVLAQTDAYRTNGTVGKEKEEISIQNFLNKYCTSEEEDDEISDEEIEAAIASFVEEDNRNTLRVLVINKDNQFEVRESFYQYDELVEKEDLKVLAVSPVYYDCDIDCCDNCEKEEYNEDLDESYCTEGCSRIKCAVEQQLAEDYDEYLWTVQGVH